MAKRSKIKSSNKIKAEAPRFIKNRFKEGVLIAVGAFALFFLLALVSYHRSDPGWSADNLMPVQNAGGRVGAWSADFLLSLFGFFGFATPFLMVYAIFVLYRDRQQKEGLYSLLLLRWFGGILIFAAGSGLSAILFTEYGYLLPQDAGGIVGSLTGIGLLPIFNFVGSLVILGAAFLVGVVWFSGVSWFGMLAGITKWLKVKSSQLKEKYKNWRQLRAEQRRERQQQREKEKLARLSAAPAVIDVEPVFAAKAETISTALEEDVPIVIKREEQQMKMDFQPKIKIVEPVKSEGHPDTDSIKPDDSKIRKASFTGEMPSADLLDLATAAVETEVSSDALTHMAKMVEEKLADFNIKAKVVGVCPGPIVTRFELQLAPGVKVSKLSGLSKDLARSLSAFSVRIVEVIPGKSVVGIELPNETREIVRLREIIESKKFQESKSPLIMALGKDIGGAAEVADLAKMPHLLVAGTTGSGKSVGLNAMLLSMLLKSTPDEVRLIMIDPKMLELSVYEGIPHLLTPVVTDMKEAANALRWCVKEMDRRYELMAAVGVRNIAGLNEKIRQAKEADEPLLDPIYAKLHPGMDAPELELMPYIVVLVDEFADMIMVVGKKVEELIARLAQKARAAGVHLILATQRPSVDVITGLIKANIPTRIAFQVSSKIDSRTILDQQGAEQLLGHGDMLYLPPGTAVPTRVHGAFVADHEVHKIVEVWRELGEPEYIESILQTASSDSGDAAGSDDVEKDPLYDEAVAIVLETQRASISGIQRKLRIGYNRSARLLDQMEAAGIVSEMQQSGLREILVPNAGAQE